MSEDARALEAVKFPRYERRGFFLGLKWYQLLIVAGGGAVAIVASASGGPAGLFTSGPMWLGLVLLGLLQYSRIPYPVWAKQIALFFYRAAAGQTRFLARPAAPQLAGRLALPGGLGNLEIRTTTRGECFIVDRHGREAIALLRCSTRSFALLDGDDKAWAVQAWSRVQAGMAQRPGVARIAVQDYTVMAVEEHWTYVRTDTGFHQTFWIAEWPRQKVFPGFLHPLIYVGEFRHTVTEVIRAVPTTEALRDIRSAQEAHETRRRINTRFDRPLTREQKAEEEEVAQREEEIVAGHGDVRPAAYVTITAQPLRILPATVRNWSRPRREHSWNCAAGRPTMGGVRGRGSPVRKGTAMRRSTHAVQYVPQAPSGEGRRNAPARGQRPKPIRPA
jgi:hypothetical protein